MKTNIELSKIEGYPEIMAHIVSVSEAVKISFKDYDSYGFAVILDNCRCINVYRECKAISSADEIHDIDALRGYLISQIRLVNPSFAQKAADITDLNINNIDVTKSSGL